MWAAQGKVSSCTRPRAIKAGERHGTAAKTDQQRCREDKPAAPPRRWINSAPSFAGSTHFATVAGAGARFVHAHDGMLAQKAHDVLELTPWTISLGRPHCSPGPSQTLQPPDGAATPSHSRAWPCRGPSQAGRHCPHQVPSPGANKLLNAAAHCSTPNPHNRCKSQMMPSQSQPRC